MEAKKLVSMPEDLWNWVHNESERMERSASWVIRHYLRRAMESKSVVAAPEYTGTGLMRDKTLAILDYCKVPRTVKEIEAHLVSLGYEAYDTYTRMSVLCNTQKVVTRVGRATYRAL